MSRIAKAPVTIPNGVDIKLDGNKMTVKGSKGQLSHILILQLILILQIM